MFVQEFVPPESGDYEETLEVRDEIRDHSVRAAKDTQSLCSESEKRNLTRMKVCA